MTYDFDETREVLVLGGGPGGSATAAFLARDGHDVLLLEKDRFPRFHIGESLLPCAAPVLRELGLFEEVDARFLRKYSARFVDDGRPLEDPRGVARFAFDEAFPPSIPHAWQVPRDQFDDLLLRNAQRLGAEVREGVRIKRALFDEQDRAVGVELAREDGGTMRIGARVLVDATGREALVARNRGSRTRVPGLDKTAIFTQFRGGFRHPGIDAGQIEIVVLHHEECAREGAVSGWAWFIPFKDGRSSAGFVLPASTVRRLGTLPQSHATPELAPGAGSFELTSGEAARDNNARLEPLYRDLLARSPWLSHLLAGTERLEPVRAAADYSFRVSEVAGNGWLSVGDATGFLDPLFSSGANLALAGALRAAPAIHAALRAGDVSHARFAKYESDVREAASLFLGPVQAFYRNELQPYLFAESQRPILRKMITTMLAGDVFPPDGYPPRWVGFFKKQFPVSL